MRYFAFRCDYGLTADSASPHALVVLVSEDALRCAAGLAGAVQGMLELAPPEVESIDARLEEALCLGVDVVVGSSDLELDLLLAVASVRERSYHVLSAQEYELLLQYRHCYPFRFMELRAVFTASVAAGIRLYVEAHDGSRYRLDEEAVSNVVSQLQPIEVGRSHLSEMPESVLSYTVELSRLPDGSYHVCVPYLGRWCCQADGDTVEEALSTLQEVYDSLRAFVNRTIPVCSGG